MAFSRCFENFILIMSNMTLISQTNSRHAGDIKEEAKELQNEDEVGTVEIKCEAFIQNLFAKNSTLLNFMSKNFLSGN